MSEPRRSVPAGASADVLHDVGEAIPVEGVFARIEEAVEDIRRGRVVIVVDDADRENEGDFVMAAEKVTPEAINFMATHGRGLICTPCEGRRLEELGIPMMVPSGQAGGETAFAVSIDVRGKTTTGTSAYDRAATVRSVAEPTTGPEDIKMPGHVFPLRAQEGGVLRRAGHTEASVDLAKLAGLFPAGVICEIMHADGTMARLPELVRVARQHGLRIISIAVDGVSLTVATVDDEGFEVALIPHTLAATTLGERAPGDEVNLETDVLAKYVESLTRRGR